MYDSIASLNEVLSTPVDLRALHRNVPGHFDGSGEPFRHWDEDGEVAAGCVKCHTAEGLPMFVQNNATIAVEPSAIADLHDLPHQPARNSRCSKWPK